jgi:lysophospholipid acyltransferase (LPLAT)-like uncharacterized protein
MTNQPGSNRADTSTSDGPRQLTWWRRALLAVLTPLLVGILKLVWSMFRFEVHGEERFRELADAGKPVVLAIWHEGLLVICWYAARLLGDGVKATFLISPSVDGEVGVQLLAWFGGKAVRGSARRSGASALRGLNRAIRREGQLPFITLDGSKGPRGYCKPGAIAVARMAGVPIVPIGCAAQRSWRMPTWDRHLVPKPFSRVVLSVGEPYTVPRQLDDEALEEQRSGLEGRVNRQMQEAEKLVESGAGPVPSADNKEKTKEDR